MCGLDHTAGFLRPDEIVLTGPEQQVRDACIAAGVASDIEIVDAPDLLSCDDSPTEAMRNKPRNSIAIGIQLVKEGKASGFVSAGSTGTVVADRTGAVTAYAIAGIQERASLFVAPTDKVYAGMIVGENPRSEDMDVNICREKKLTNVRAAASDDTIRRTPPRRLSLEQALEFIADDECVEVTPGAVRLRKVTLDAGERARHVKRLKNARV